jgi:hypothetical protein
MVGYVTRDARVAGIRASFVPDDSTDMVPGGLLYGKRGYPASCRP